MTRLAVSPHRTQAERRAQTRRALLDATIDLLLDRGLGACSLAHVAKRAGLTTGAVQHHFDTKADLMRAVITERLFDPSRRTLPPDLADLPLAKRCQEVIVHQWAYYGDPKYLAIWNIILEGRSDDAITGEVITWQRNGIAAYERALARAFADQKLMPRQIKTIQYFINAQLRGLALLRTIDDNPRILKTQLNLTADLLEKHIREIQKG